MLSSLTGWTSPSAWGTFGLQSVDGMVDDVRLYERALTAAEVADLAGNFSVATTHTADAANTIPPSIRVAPTPRDLGLSVHGESPQAIHLYDVRGICVAKVMGNASGNYHIPRKSLSGGHYVVKAIYSSGNVLTRQCVIF